MLKRPSRNHTDEFVPVVERFVFSVADGNSTIASADEMSPMQRAEVLTAFRAPLPLMWLECGPWGFLLADGQVTALAKMGKKTHALAFASLDDIRSTGDCQRFTELYALGTESWWAVNTDMVGARFILFGMLCAIINSPRSATRERVVMRSGTPEARLARLRRGQRGYPVFSFNRITLKRPETSLQRGDVLVTCPQTSKRGHWVIGHWRLIDGNPEPYWTWVESHTRGEESLGFVSHERHVEISDDGLHLRRGFVIPGAPGAPGVRVSAVAAERALR